MHDANQMLWNFQETSWSDTNVYIVKDSLLELAPVKPVYFNEKTVVVKGLKDGDILVSKPVPGAYTGMHVQLFNGK